MFNKNLLVFNTNIVVSHKKIFLKAVVKSLSEIFTEYVKQQLEIPKNVTVKGILKDSKGRELSTVSR